MEPQRPDRPAPTRRYPRLRTLVLLSALAVVPAFGATGVVVRMHREHQERLAVYWAERAETRLKAGRPLEAAQAYRTALSYAREDADYQLRLARALVKADRRAEARSYLVALVNRDPSHGAVNLELARLSARQGEHASAVQHYHRAIDGYWENDAPGERRAARLELASYLLRRGEGAAAVAELMGLAADLPPDAGLYSRVAGELTRAGAHPQALDLYRRALDIDPEHAAALLGAGRSTFALGDYQAARRYLTRYRRTVAQGAVEGDARVLLEALAYLGEVNVREPRLTTAQRAARAIRALTLASNRLACVPSGAAELSARVEQARAEATLSTLRRDPDRIEAVFELALEAALFAANRCAAPEGPDLALLTLAQQARVDDDRRR